MADRFRSRLLGLALLSRECAGTGLLLPRCRSVHTFGMRFELDLVFLDHAGEPIEVRPAVPPGRVVRRAGAAAVLELPAGAADAGPAIGADGPAAPVEADDHQPQEQPQSRAHA